MENKNEKGITDVSRRDFLKAAGVGVAAMAIPAAGLIRNAGAASVSTVNQEIIETDVLVIGGGVAGTFAAVKAKEKGVDVVLVDKGYVGRSGSTPFFTGFNTYDPEGGHSKESYLASDGKQEFIARLDYAKMWLDKSLEIG